MHYGINDFTGADMSFMWLFMYLGSEYYNSSYVYGQKLDCYLRLYGLYCLNLKCLAFKPYDRLRMDLSDLDCHGMQMPSSKTMAV